MKPITDMQMKIYEFLKERAQSGGIPPTVREIGNEVGLKSPASVQAHLNALEEAGYISRGAQNVKRSIKVEGMCDNINHVPILGDVAAGTPILANENIDGYIPYAGNVSRDKPLFALNIRGESMVNAGIMNGDIIVVEQTPTARNGEIVVAMIDDEATTKRFYKENGKIRLQPENDYMEPIIVDDCSILGKVIAVVRYY